MTSDWPPSQWRTFPLISYLNFPWWSFIRCPCVILLVTREETITTPLPTASLEEVVTANGSSLRVLFSKLKKPVTSATPPKSCLWDLSPSLSCSSGHTLRVWCPLHIEVPKTTGSTQGGTTPVQCRLGKSPPWNWLATLWNPGWKPILSCLLQKSHIVHLHQMQPQLAPDRTVSK